MKTQNKLTDKEITLIRIALSSELEVDEAYLKKVKELGSKDTQYWEDQVKSMEELIIKLTKMQIEENRKSMGIKG